MHGVGHCHLEKYKVCQENIWQPLAINCHAPPHASRQTKLLEETNEMPMLSWPAQSPDLNIIEYVWLLMKNIAKKNMGDINTLVVVVIHALIFGDMTL
jgi:hypothetical protein